MKKITKRDPKQVAYIKSLREFARFLELNPSVGLPSTQKMYVFPEVEEMAAYAKAMGNCRKSADDSYFNLTKDFLPAIQYEPTWYRENVCERVVVGQRTVDKPIMQQVGTESVTEDVYEWKCPKVLAPRLEERTGE
jgi:hypothetical protein